MAIYKVLLLDGPLEGIHARKNHRPLDGDEFFVTQYAPDALNYRKLLYEFSERRKGFFFVRQLEGLGRPSGAP